ncbi:arginyltransferase [Parvularcula dongshanensis]|uniref:Aspartate/glutamate leucyltransferase n=1 Tax=Parvularcula dongshanensis TaxID=1173995 RepID=A0A840I2P1_9PROT|nr:arginyltransferase [Parvularcula dongshanensis]MBB4658605.1 arginine-tRNA-protein transferase [Parvularcula dongshanensis]
MTNAFPPHGSSTSREFYLTAPAACPYLPGQQERKVFTFLGGEGATALNGTLSQRGFRRSQNIAYLPACERCSACKPVRIRAAEFDERPWRRVLKRNRDLTRRTKPAKITTEQFSVLRGYLDARHAGGGMAGMTVLDYAQMVEQTPVATELHEYRDPHGQLVACALTDRLEDGFSMVYSFFEPDEAARSLGTYMIAEHVLQAQADGLPYVYLGYWVEGSEKMGYKRRFSPLEVLTRRGWAAIE